MIKELKYNGYTASPSDYECKDGDLSVALGLIPEDGNIKPILPATVVMKLAQDEKILYIHQTAHFKHYIAFDDDTLAWIDEKNIQEDLSYVGWSDLCSIKDDVTGAIKSLNAIGNTLILTCEKVISYFRWVQDDYVYMGDHIPEIDLTFGLVGFPKRSDVKEISWDEAIQAGEANIDDDSRSSITEQIMGTVNKFVKEEGEDKDMFTFPFFVRYALRLYDGSLVNHSCPVLMNPMMPLVVAYTPNTASSGTQTFSSASCYVVMTPAMLSYKCTSYLDKLKSEWADIVESVDIFVSAPIYPYDSSSDIKCFEYSKSTNPKYVGALRCTYNASASLNSTWPINNTMPITVDGSSIQQNNGLLKMYTEWDSDFFAELLVPRRDYVRLYMNLDEYSQNEMDDKYLKVHDFYFLTSIPIENVASSNEMSALPTKKGCLSALVNKEVMTDDYLSHERFNAKGSFTYNSRLNLYGITRTLFEGFSPMTMFAYKNLPGVTYERSIYNGLNAISITRIERSHEQTNYSNITVYIKENDAIYSVTSQGYNMESPRGAFVDDDGVAQSLPLQWGRYVFYPYTKAYQMLINDEDSGGYLIDLKPHDFLNGAVGIIPADLTREINYSDDDLPEAIDGSTARLNVYNKLYTSAVNNPYYYPLEGIKTIGTGEIIGISTAAKALSQGQFGQFPLYAFTDDGVWALEVSTDGFFKPSQPISRDVCINAESITQIDSAVLFITDRGIMLISGSETICISDALDSVEVFSPLQTCGDWLSRLSGFSEEEMSFVPYREFIANAKMLYDYNNQRIIVYNTAIRYAYVYSLKDKKWGMMSSHIVRGCNSYPETLATILNGSVDKVELVDFSKPDRAAAEGGINGLLITRPLKLDEPDILKTFNAVFQRGYFRKGHVQQILYGSNDLFHWAPVWTSKSERMQGFSGTPFKYHRIVVVGIFKKDESILGCTIGYFRRQTNKIR